MSTVTFPNGKTATFQGTPTPEDIDFVAKQMGIQPDAPKAKEGGGFLDTAAHVGAGAINLLNNNPVSRGIVSLAALPTQGLAKLMGQPDPFAGGIGGSQGGMIKPVGVTSSDQPMGDFLKEEAGNAATVGSLFIPAGKIAGATQQALTKVLPNAASRFIPTLSNVAAGAATGYATDVGANLQEKKQDVFSPGAGTAFGATLPLISPILKGIGKTASMSTGITTGAGTDAIQEGYAAGKEGGKASQAYFRSLWGKVQPDEIVQQAKDELGGIVNQRRQGYQELLKTMQSQTGSHDITPVVKELDKQLERFRVGIADDGTLDFSRRDRKSVV